VYFDGRAMTTVSFAATFRPRNEHCIKPGATQRVMCSALTGPTRCIAHDMCGCRGHARERYRAAAGLIT
jgi:hypothetical protein